MNDLELEELEAHLYSQVYHSNEEVNQNQSSLPFEHLQASVDTMKNPNRYFQRIPRTNGPRFQSRQIIATQHNHKSPVCNNDDQTQGIYSKDCTRPHKRDISINQLVVISPQQAPIVCVTKNDSSKQKKARWRAAKWRAKSKEKRKRQKLVEMLNSSKHVESDVITVSDSDSDGCVEVSDQCPVVSVADSEDEVNKGKKLEEFSDITSTNDANLSTQSLGDDVIFVEPANTSVEVINLDEEIDNAQNISEDVDVHVDIETGSVTSSNNSFIHQYAQPKSANARVHQERKELLYTPDSASNDFIHNVELNQENFNFSLHGRDFNNDKFLKPANPTDTCETESSSSTTELNAVNAMKTVVFNEIEFPKDDIFSDANLESFGNFITPLRQSKDKQTVQSTPSKKTKKTPEENVYVSADSSSESDYDEININKQKEKTKSKHLPDLSPMHSDNEKTSQKGAKKSKKVINVFSKYDLINPTVTEIVVKKNKQKKRKSLPVLETLNNSKKKSKNKKRKSDTFINDQSSLTMTEVVSSTTEKNSTICSNTKQSGAEENLTTGQNYDTVDGEIKQKKRKSSQLADESFENPNNSQSKKRRSKKKKNNTETESDGNVTDLETSQQVVDENPITDQSLNVESTNQTDAQSDNVAVTSDQVPEQQSLALEVDVSVKMAQDGADSVQLTKSEETAVAVQKDFEINIENSSKMLEISTDDVILIEQPPNPEIVLSSDSESNLSPLVDQHDIQLINCGEPPKPPPPPNVDQLQGPSKPIIDLSNSTVEELQHTMSSDPKLWSILESDRIPVREDTRGRRCNRCREKGHMAIRCPNKVTPKCYLCGKPGHYEPRCPNRICTQCGERSPYSTTYCKLCFKFRSHQCEICFMVGHGAETCPDLWRRYHLTTSEGPLTICNGPLLKPKHKLWCSGCARPGHLEYTCRFFKSLYPPADPHIKNYDDVYRSRGSEQTQGMTHPLFYNRGYPVPPDPQFVYRDSYQGNNFVMNPFVNNALGPMFQQSPAVFFNSGGSNMYPPNQFNLVHNQQSSSNNFYFEDNLPNFFSFETPEPTSNNNNYQVVEERPYYNRNENVTPMASTATVNNNIRQLPRQVKQNTAVFYSSSAENIQRLISNELKQLVHMSYRVTGVVKNLKKQRLEFSKNHRQNRYYRTLNMVLFGIYKLLEGEKHLVKLKTFKMKPLKAKLSQERRHDLYRSYCYIFGIAKHSGVDYNELLRRL